MRCCLAEDGCVSWSSFYIQILISSAIALGALILTIIDILPLRILIGLVPILVLLAILRNSIDKRTNKKGQSVPTHAREIYSYLDVLYNDVGLFIQQYYDSENSHNNQKTKTLNEKMGEFVPLMSRYKLLVSDKLITEITTFFDILFNYKRRIEGAVSRNRDETAYNRWLQINNEFGKTVAPMLENLERKLRQH